MTGAVFLRICADTQKGQPEKSGCPFVCKIMADRLFIFRGFS